MSILTWFSTTANKSVVAAEIQTMLESLEKVCIVETPSSKLANQLVELAYTNMPSLSNAKYNKSVKAAIVLAMAPLFPSLSHNQRDLCKLALGAILSITHSLEAQGLLRLSQSEKNILERAEQLFIQASAPDPNINLGEAAFSKVPNQGKSHDQALTNLNESNFTELEVQALKTLAPSIERKSKLLAFIEIIPLNANSSVAGIGVKKSNGKSINFISIVKHNEQYKTTLSVRGFDGHPLPNAPDYFDNIDDLIRFTQPYLDFICASTEQHQ